MGAVHKQIIRLEGQGKDRLPHCLQGGLQDIESIDVGGRNDPDAHGGRLSIDDVKGLGSGLGRHFFGISDPLVKRFVREDHGSRDNRAGQGTATGLVNAGDQPIAGRPEQSFMKKRIRL
jgi:hypothetical protein